MQKYTYIDTRNGKRYSSSSPIEFAKEDRDHIKLIVAIRGSIPRGMEKNKKLIKRND